MRKFCLLAAAAAFQFVVSGMVFAAGPKQPVVAYHLSFESTDFLKDEIIAQSGKKTLDERKIDFPGGRFGKGIRMNSIPVTPDIDNMSGIDLDMITSLIFNTRPHTDRGFNEPFFWGSGRCNPRLGAVAFWGKGEPPFAWPLFEQTSNAFGRLERDLIGINLDEKRRISAYVRDARYVRHELKTEVVWDTAKWNHVVLNWDWANGLELWLNGEKIASSWGKDSWFDAMHPGLFHLPTAGIIYDEVYLMDRPLSSGEIRNLLKSNKAPGEVDIAVLRRDGGEMSRAAKVSGADRNGDFPAVTPDSPLLVQEVWPTEAVDGHIPGWFVLDGRNELAWPHEYAFFTIIPGDGDFHAEKVDIKTRPRAKVNYITLSGNLADVKVQAGSPDMTDVGDVFSVPAGNGYYYGKTVDVNSGSTFRIPFTTGYGAPPGFQGDIWLPLSGEKRIHEVGLYHVSKMSGVPGGDVLAIVPYNSDLGKKYNFAIQAMTARDERTVGLA
ncbi:MAG: hypothetical protein ACYC9O_21115, partial [Candidatus Latescibacterota bacterium]